MLTTHDVVLLCILSCGAIYLNWGVITSDWQNWRKASPRSSSTFVARKKIKLGSSRAQVTANSIGDAA